MDYQSVAPPSNYGAPQVFGQQGQQQQGQGQPGGQQQGQNPVSALLQKAKQMLSQGTISADQYSQIAQQAGNASLPYSGGNMGSGMPGAPQAGAPMNIAPQGV